MDIKEIMRTDPYFRKQYECPNCKEMQFKIPGRICNNCMCMVFDKDEEGMLSLINPSEIDRTKKYSVHGGLSYLDKEDHTFFPGDLVELDTYPPMSDTAIHYYVDGESVSKFLMPAHDVNIEWSSESVMGLGSEITIPMEQNDGNHPKDSKPCPMCSTINVSGAKFCHNCGSIL